MARRPIPEHWRIIMDRRGISSIRALADRAGVSHPSVMNAMHGGKSAPSAETVHRIARALNIPLRDVYALMGQPNELAEVWDPPAEANLMTRRQRAAVEQLIRAIVEEEPESIHDNVHQLHPERDNMGLAAHKGHGLSAGQLDWDAGEESQDD